jgi:hypothetical protein
MKIGPLHGLGVPLALAVSLPLAGVALAGFPLARYLEFPPVSRYVEPAPFSWLAFTVFSLIIAGLLAPFVILVRRARPIPVREEARSSTHPFPAWGWLALVAGAVCWTLAWTRFPWFAPLQPHTFTPLWICFIVVLNALAYRRSGRCLLTDEAGYLARLFPVSAAFWWFFEFLNRFVQNWHYAGVQGWSGLEYFLVATLSFSTVLPAVVSTERLLEAYGIPGPALAGGRAIRIGRPRRAAVALGVLAAAGLVLVGLFPSQLFPLLWVAPLALFLAWDVLRGRPTLLDAAGRGDWRRIVRLALSALVCGWFWEMWNWLSLAKWIYAVPYVYAFRIFEMPLLGFAGYLPFGLECAVIADRYRRRVRADDLEKKGTAEER